MDPFKEFLDDVYQNHVVTREQIRCMEVAISSLDETGAWDKVLEILSFFDYHIPRHCGMEDDLISLVRFSEQECSADELQVIYELQQEHRVMVACFKQLSVVAEAYEASGDVGIRGIYCDLALDIIDKTYSHTGMEERVLYPLAYRILTGQPLQEPDRLLRRALTSHPALDIQPE